ncbi:MAG: transporter [Herminiimonas sp.]|nr:transporter [Herminiimonas sp.]MDB5852973.1 transporter [Herminiimonas sp.]
MSATSTSVSVEALPSAYPHSKSNLASLTIAQALAGANTTVIFATGAIVGSTLAPNQALATLPISLFVVGMAACALPAGVIAQRRGRGAAFLVGTACGVIVGLLSALAVVLGSFWLYCVATFFGGAYAAVVFSYRFAAADCVPPDRRPRALSFVMAGGVFAGVIGPQLVNYTMDLWAPYTFAVTFLAQAAVAVLSALILLRVRIPPPVALQSISAPRPMRVIAFQPKFMIAVICGVVSYLLMNFLMTSAPLAMRMCGLPQKAANLGVQWHVVAMYAPGFFTGSLIARFGAHKVIMAGLLLTGLAAAIGLSGVDVDHFWLMLIVLGIAWNFGFIGASALVLQSHRPEEKSRVQSFNDFIVFGSVAVGSFLSGGLLTVYGWSTVLWLSFVPLTVAVVILGGASIARAKQRA